MSQAPCQSRGLHPTRTAVGVFGISGSMLIRLDPDGLRHAATILVWHTGSWSPSALCSSCQGCRRSAILSS